MKTLIAALAFAAAPFAAVGVHAEPPRDPFQAFTQEEPVVGFGEGRCSESVAACASLDDVAVKGIVTGTASPRAMVEVKDGSAVLRVGDLIGKGRITAITRLGIVVERFYFSAATGTVRTKVVLPLG
jgi:Tfp pilus assembly protein PilP